MSARFEKLLSPVRVGALHFKNRIYKPPSGTKLFNNTNRVVSYNPATGRPEDRDFQDPEKRIPGQIHY